MYCNTVVTLISLHYISNWKIWQLVIYSNILCTENTDQFDSNEMSKPFAKIVTPKKVNNYIFFQKFQIKRTIVLFSITLVIQYILFFSFIAFHIFMISRIQNLPWHMWDMVTMTMNYCISPTRINVLKYKEQRWRYKMSMNHLVTHRMWYETENKLWVLMFFLSIYKYIFLYTNKKCPKVIIFKFH